MDMSVRKIKNSSPPLATNAINERENERTKWKKQTT